MSNDIAEQYAFDRTSGNQVFPGQTIQSSRDETWTFERVSRKAYGNSTGRVLVSAACEGEQGYGDCEHSWHKNGIETREFFPSVFDLYLGLADGTEA